MHILVTPIVGGIIGYFTNWLAIKMLFFPRYEKKVFGFTLPFTPGVLPKSKQRLAHTIGDTVGDYLLTDEALKTAIMNANIDDSLSKLMDEAYNGVANNHNTVGYYYHSIFSADGEQMLSAFGNHIEKMLLDYVGDTGNQQKLVDYILVFFNDYIKKTAVKPLAHDGLDFIMNAVQSAGRDYLDSGEIMQWIDKTTDGWLDTIISDSRPMSDILPAEVISGLKTSVIAIMPRISRVFSDVLTENDGLNNQLLGLTKKVVEDSVGQFIGSLVYKRVYQSIKDNALELVSNPENLVIFSEKICGFIDEFLSNEPRHALDKISFSKDMKDRIMDKMHLLIYGNMDDIIDKFSEFLRTKVNGYDEVSLYDILNKIMPDYDEKARAFLLKFMNDTIEKKGREFIGYGYSKMLNLILEQQISAITQMVNQDSFEKFKTWLLAQKGELVEKGAALISEKLNIRQIVEEKINELDVKQMEEIILNVANKELNYITVMGGVLGFILGFVPELVSNFY